jgi:glycosyltransferase involved in cell wall biosynthesis
MPKPIVTVFYQFDPWSNSLGGIQTIIRTFIKYAPDSFELRLVGTQMEARARPGTWHEAELGGRSIQFLPLFTQQKDNQRSLIPVTVRYAASLVGRDFSSDFMHFHRIEPTLATLKWTGDKTLFIHNDIQQQITPDRQKGGILWQRLPGAYFALEGLVIPQFTEILSCNSASTRFYQQRYPDYADRVRYLRNTVDNEIFFPLSEGDRAQARQSYAHSLGLPTQTKFILFAGRLHAQKDPLLLVNAIAALGETNTHLLIAGAGDLAAALNLEIERLGLKRQVTLLGALNQTELSKLHRLASIFVLSSVYEGLPVTVLEALASGTPVVTTRCGETPHLLSPESGVVCDDRTPTALAAALKQVLDHPQSFPTQACVDSAAPYSARTVVQGIGDAMMQRWKDRQSTHRLTATHFSPS